MSVSHITFVFPGQASQEVGMGQALADHSPAARAVFEQADETLSFPLSRLCFEGPEADLNDTLNTQAAIFTTSLAALAALRESGFTSQPAYVAGHSLGEYSAYVAAGVLSFADGLRLVRTRGRLMKQAGALEPGAMAAILKLDDATVTGICEQVTAEGKGLLQVANYNAPGQVVISGQIGAIERAAELVQAAKGRAMRLPVSIASHSELMRGISSEFREAIDRTPLNLPEIPIVANISAEPLTSLAAIRSEMEDQLTASVRWTETILWLVDHQITTFVEIGPKNVLAGMIRRIAKEAAVFSVGDPAGIDSLLASLSTQVDNRL
jgi:[acyl-carrier-protein] S-malonyltransferase